MKNRAKRRRQKQPTANARREEEIRATAIWWKLQDALSNLGRKRFARNPK